MTHLLLLTLDLGSLLAHCGWYRKIGVGLVRWEILWVDSHRAMIPEREREREREKTVQMRTIIEFKNVAVQMRTIIGFENGGTNLRLKMDKYKVGMRVEIVGHSDGFWNSYYVQKSYGICLLRETDNNGGRNQKNDRMTVYCRRAAATRSLTGDSGETNTCNLCRRRSNPTGVSGASVIKSGERELQEFKFYGPYMDSNAVSQRDDEATQPQVIFIDHSVLICASINSCAFSHPPPMIFPNINNISNSDET
ncbi:hypothetical protein LXL04_029523 [Taraxacum kok-saghyz]